MTAVRDTGTTVPLAFAKMHGLGNDFVVIDRRARTLRLSAPLVRAIGDRHRGVGFDQLAVIDAGDSDADLQLTFWNPDGTQSAACGNATRCIAVREMARTGKDRLILRTARGELIAEMRAGETTAWVNMGPPMLDWQGVPLVRAMDTLHLPIAGDPVGTGMGNPHCSFFVDDADAVAIAEFGPRYEHHPLFPERTNVEVVQVLAHDRIRLRIWERGTGVTLASGSCASAAAVAAARRGLTGRRVSVIVDGGQLEIDWRRDGVWLTGPVAHVFDGVFRPDWLDGMA